MSFVNGYRCRNCSSVVVDYSSYRPSDPCQKCAGNSWAYAVLEKINTSKWWNPLTWFTYKLEELR